MCRESRLGTLNGMTSISTSPGGASSSTARLAAATPAGRDRYADLLRLYSIAMVALGHWVVALLTVGGAGTVNTAMPVMLSTWVWQVMALFFFVGGFAHAHALRHRPPLRTFVPARMARLLPPAVVMLGIWTVLASMTGTAGLANGELAVGLHKITVALWFLGVYLAIVLTAPTMMRLHERFGLWPVVGVLALATAITDLMNIGAGLHLLGYANLLFVWVAVHQLGFGYADGTLLGGGRRVAVAMAAGGLGATVALVFGTHWYPILMVGLPGNEAANSSPPTMALLTQSFFLVGSALLLRPAGTALANRPTAWLIIAVGNSVIMTIFCWHLTACYLVQGVLLVTRIQLPAANTLLWLPVLAGWLLACTAVCAGLVRLFRRFEQSWAPAPVGSSTVILAVLASTIGLFTVSATGLDTLSLRHPITALPAATAVCLIAMGVILLRGRTHTTS